MIIDNIKYEDLKNKLINNQETLVLFHSEGNGECQIANDYLSKSEISYFLIDVDDSKLWNSKEAKITQTPILRIYKNFDDYSDLKGFESIFKHFMK